jgi:hypothetical protein
MHIAARVPDLYITAGRFEYSVAAHIFYRDQTAGRPAAQISVYFAYTNVAAVRREVAIAADAITLQFTAPRVHFQIAIDTLRFDRAFARSYGGDPQAGHFDGQIRGYRGPHQHCPAFGRSGVDAIPAQDTPRIIFRASLHG